MWLADFSIKVPENLFLTKGAKLLKCPCRHHPQTLSMLTLEWAAEINARAKRLAVREAHRQLCGVGLPHSLLCKRTLSWSQNQNLTGHH